MRRFSKWPDRVRLWIRRRGVLERRACKDFGAVRLSALLSGRVNKCSSGMSRLSEDMLDDDTDDYDDDDNMVIEKGTVINQVGI